MLLISAVSELLKKKSSEKQSKPLRYHFENLKSGKTRIQFTIDNKGTEDLLVKGEILEMKHLNLPYEPPPFFLTPEVEIPKGTTKVYEFKLPSDASLLPGTYSGKIAIGEKEKEPLLSQDIAITSGKVDLEFEGEPEVLTFRFFDKNGNPYHQRIEIPIHNKGGIGDTFLWEIYVPNLRCTEGAYPNQSIFKRFNDGTSEPTNKVIIQPGKTKDLVFGLTQSSLCFQDKERNQKHDSATLISGVYDGELVLSREMNSENKYKVSKAITFEVPDLLDTDEAFIAFLRQKFQETFNTSRSLGPYSWWLSLIALVIFIPFCWWRIKRWIWRWRGFKHFIEMKDIKDVDNASTKNAASISAIIRERLSDCGSTPTSVAPGASNVQDALSAVGALLPTLQGKTIQRIATFLLTKIVRKVGYEVTGTLYTQDSPSKYFLTLNLKDSITQKTNIIKTFRGDTHEEVAKESAYYIHHTATEHYSRRKPGWSQFSSFESFSWYKEGQRLEKEEKFLDALKSYRISAEKALNNAEVRLRLATLIEKEAFASKAKLTDALRLYLIISHISPRFLEAQYRLAITFSFEKLAEFWTQLGISHDPEEKKEVARLYELLKKDEPDLEVSGINRRFFLQQASEILKNLQTHLGFGNTLGAFIGSFFPWTPPDETERRYWSYYLRSPRARTYFARVVKIAGYVVDLQLNLDHEILSKKCFKNFHEKLEKIFTDERWLWKYWNNFWNNWNVYYNAMCFYSIARKKLSASDYVEKAVCLRRCIELLKKIYADPHNQLNSDWLNKDPDLENVRSEPFFQAFLEENQSLTKQLEQDISADDQRAKAVCAGWGYLSSGANVQATVWEDRLKDVKGWRNIHFADLNKWCQEEREIWDALGDWGMSPHSGQLRKVYWARAKKADTSTPEDAGRKQEGEPENELFHVVTWYQIALCASYLEEIWEHREKETELLALHKTAVTIEDVRSWVLEEKKLWQRLVTVSAVPLKDWPLEKFRGLLATSHLRTQLESIR